MFVSVQVQYCVVCEICMMECPLYLTNKKACPVIKHTRKSQEHRRNVENNTLSHRCNYKLFLMHDFIIDIIFKALETIISLSILQYQYKNPSWDQTVKINAELIHL